MSDEERVYVCGEDAAARLILNALADFYEKDDAFAECFAQDGGHVNVRMTVNGRPVPIAKTLAEAWKRADAQVEERARKIAIRMVTEAGLEPLAEVLRDAEQKIRQKLQIWDDANG